MNKEQRSIWRKENPEKHREEQREHYKRNSEKERVRSSKYKKNNPDKVVGHFQDRRARKTQVGGSVTPEEWFTLCFAVGFKCLCCDQADPLVRDHVVPISKGGTNWLHNIQPLCQPCNSKKYTKCTDYRL